jgi:hypothetical protein
MPLANSDNGMECREVFAMLKRWLAEAEGFRLSASRLLAVAQLPRIGAAATTVHLNELDRVSNQLSEGSAAFEHACQALPADVRESSQVEDVRSSIARSRAILDQARQLLEARTWFG